MKMATGLQPAIAGGLAGLALSLIEKRTERAVVGGVIFRPTATTEINFQLEIIVRGGEQLGYYSLKPSRVASNWPELVLAVV